MTRVDLLDFGCVELIENIFGYIWTEREIREGRLPITLRTVPWPDSVPFERQVAP